MALALRDLPRYLVIAAASTLRLDMHLDAPACEIDISLDNPKPGRSFVMLIGHPGGPMVQRVRLAGRARIFFDPESPGDYVLLLSNPDRAPIVLRLRARGVGAVVRGKKAPKRKLRGRSPRAARGESDRSAAADVPSRSEGV